MNLVKRLGTAIGVLALVATMAGSASAQVLGEEVAGYAGHAYVDLTHGTSTWESALPSLLVGTTIYNCIASPALFAVSSTDLAAQWGDQVAAIGTGTLEEQDFTVFNSGSSAGPLLTATCGLFFNDNGTLAPLGSYSTNVSFGVGGLPVGFYSIVTVTGLSALSINLPTTNLLLRQTVISKTGTANRLGIASLTPPTVGSSPTSMFISATTIGGGVAGFYTFTNGPADPGYRVNAIPFPVPVQTTSWGRLKSLYK